MPYVQPQYNVQNVPVPSVNMANVGRQGGDTINQALVQIAALIQQQAEGKRDFRRRRQLMNEEYQLKGKYDEASDNREHKLGLERLGAEYRLKGDFDKSSDERKNAAALEQLRLQFNLAESNDAASDARAHTSAMSQLQEAIMLQDPVVQRGMAANRVAGIPQGAAANMVTNANAGNPTATAMDGYNKLLADIVKTDLNSEVARLETIGKTTNDVAVRNLMDAREQELRQKLIDAAMEQEFLHTRVQLLAKVPDPAREIDFLDKQTSKWMNLHRQQEGVLSAAVSGAVNDAAVLARDLQGTPTYSIGGTKYQLGNVSLEGKSGRDLLNDPGYRVFFKDRIMQTTSLDDNQKAFVLSRVADRYGPIEGFENRPVELTNDEVADLKVTLQALSAGINNVMKAPGTETPGTDGPVIRNTSGLQAFGRILATETGDLLGAYSGVRSTLHTQLEAYKRLSDTWEEAKRAHQGDPSAAVSAFYKAKIQESFFETLATANVLAKSGKLPKEKFDDLAHQAQKMGLGAGLLEVDVPEFRRLYAEANKRFVETEVAKLPDAINPEEFWGKSESEVTAAAGALPNKFRPGSQFTTQDAVSALGTTSPQSGVYNPTSPRAQKLLSDTFEYPSLDFGHDVVEAATTGRGVDLPDPVKPTVQMDPKVIQARDTINGLTGGKPGTAPGIPTSQPAGGGPAPMTTMVAPSIRTEIAKRFWNGLREIEPSFRYQPAASDQQAAKLRPIALAGQMSKRVEEQKAKYDADRKAAEQARLSGIMQVQAAGATPGGGANPASQQQGAPGTMQKPQGPQAPAAPSAPKPPSTPSANKETQQ